jgi:hypothetical protein
MGVAGSSTAPVLPRAISSSRAKLCSKLGRCACQTLSVHCRVQDLAPFTAPERAVVTALSTIGDMPLYDAEGGNNRNFNMPEPWTMLQAVYTAVKAHKHSIPADRLGQLLTCGHAKSRKPVVTWSFLAFCTGPCWWYVRWKIDALTCFERLTDFCRWALELGACPEVGFVCHGVPWRAPKVPSRETTLWYDDTHRFDYCPDVDSLRYDGGVNNTSVMEVLCRQRSDTCMQALLLELLSAGGKWPKGVFVPQWRRAALRWHGNFGKRAWLSVVL